MIAFLSPQSIFSLQFHASVSMPCVWACIFSNWSDQATNKFSVICEFQYLACYPFFYIIDGSRYIKNKIGPSTGKSIVLACECGRCNTKLAAN